jgi:hypothetical protein
MKILNLRIAALVLVALPGVALAATLPKTGDVLGTTPEALTTALNAAGCMVDEIGAEDGMIEAKCHLAAGEAYEIYVDPATGAVAEVELDD